MNEFELNNKLTGKSTVFFAVPKRIILNPTLDSERVSVFSYLASRHPFGGYGLTFSLNQMIMWSKNCDKTNTQHNHKKFRSIIEYLQEENFIELPADYDFKGARLVTDAYFNIEEIKDSCTEESYAGIYLDELDTIMNYRNVIDNSLDPNILLLVFAYFRLMIPRRSNTIINERDSNGLEAKKMRCIECYDAYIKDMAKDIGIHPDTMSHAIQILCDLKLLAVHVTRKVKTRDGKYYTNTYLYCNYYKREKEYLLKYGEEYFLPEFERKKKKLLNVNRK